MDFRQTTVADLARRVRAKEVSARELAQGALDRIDALNPQVNAFVAVDAEAALRDAAAVDELVAAGEDPGPLAGVPIGVKDLEDAAGFVTSMGSATRAGDSPAATDSILVARLRAAGCVVVGKTNTPEYGWKGDTENPTFGATRNPWELGHSAGGSSGGTAAALAAGMVPLATGSDGGGSIRIPAAVCGLSGFKPSLGRVAVGGPHPPNWADLSVKGPMTVKVRDAALALGPSVGPHPTDLRSLPMPSADWLDGVADPRPPRKVAWSPTMGFSPVDGEVRSLCEAALRRLEDLGTEVVEVDTVWPEDPVYAWFGLTAVATYRTLRDFEGTPEWEGIDPGLREQMGYGKDHVAAPDVLGAMDTAHRLNMALVELFHDVDFLLTPTCAGQTPPPGEFGTVNGHPEVNWVRFTYGFNLTRSPAGSVCAGLTAKGLPVGLQVVGPQHADAGVLRLMALLEDAIGFDRMAPVA